MNPILKQNLNKQRSQQIEQEIQEKNLTSYESKSSYKSLIKSKFERKKSYEVEYIPQKQVDHKPKSTTVAVAMDDSDLDDQNLKNKIDMTDPSSLSNHELKKSLHMMKQQYHNRTRELQDQRQREQFVMQTARTILNKAPQNIENDPEYQEKQRIRRQMDAIDQQLKNQSSRFKSLVLSESISNCQEQATVSYRDESHRLGFKVEDIQFKIEKQKQSDVKMHIQPENIQTESNTNNVTTQNRGSMKSLMSSNNLSICSHEFLVMQQQMKQLMQDVNVQQIAQQQDQQKIQQLQQILSPKTSSLNSVSPSSNIKKSNNLIEGNDRKFESIKNMQTEYQKKIQQMQSTRNSTQNTQIPQTRITFQRDNLEEAASMDTQVFQICQINPKIDQENQIDILDQKRKTQQIDKIDLKELHKQIDKSLEDKQQQLIKLQSHYSVQESIIENQIKDLENQLSIQDLEKGDDLQQLTQNDKNDNFKTFQNVFSIRSMANTQSVTSPSYSYSKPGSISRKLREYDNYFQSSNDQPRLSGSEPYKNDMSETGNLLCNQANQIQGERARDVTSKQVPLEAQSLGSSSIIDVNSGSFAQGAESAAEGNSKTGFNNVQKCYSDQIDVSNSFHQITSQTPQITNPSQNIQLQINDSNDIKSTEDTQFVNFQQNILKNKQKEQLPQNDIDATQPNLIQERQQNLINQQCSKIENSFKNGWNSNQNTILQPQSNQNQVYLSDTLGQQYVESSQPTFCYNSNANLNKSPQINAQNNSSGYQTTIIHNQDLNNQCVTSQNIQFYQEQPDSQGRVVDCGNVPLFNQNANFVIDSNHARNESLDMFKINAFASSLGSTGPQYFNQVSQFKKSHQSDCAPMQNVHQFNQQSQMFQYQQVVPENIKQQQIPLNQDLNSIASGDLCIPREPSQVKDYKSSFGQHYKHMLKLTSPRHAGPNNQEELRQTHCYSQRDQQVYNDQSAKSNTPFDETDKKFNVYLHDQHQKQQIGCQNCVQCYNCCQIPRINFGNGCISNKSSDQCQKCHMDHTNNNADRTKSCHQNYNRDIKDLMSRSVQTTQRQSISTKESQRGPFEPYSQIVEVGSQTLKNNTSNMIYSDHPSQNQHDLSNLQQNGSVTVCNKNRSMQLQPNTLITSATSSAVNLEQVRSQKIEAIDLDNPYSQTQNDLNIADNSLGKSNQKYSKQNEQPQSTDYMSLVSNPDQQCCMIPDKQVKRQINNFYPYSEIDQSPLLSVVDGPSNHDQDVKNQKETDRYQKKDSFLGQNRIKNNEFEIYTQKKSCQDANFDKFTKDDNKTMVQRLTEAIRKQEKIKVQLQESRMAKEEAMEQWYQDIYQKKSQLYDQQAVSSRKNSRKRSKRSGDSNSRQRLSSINAKEKQSITTLSKTTHNIKQSEKSFARNQSIPSDQGRCEKHATYCGCSFNKKNSTASIKPRILNQAPKHASLKMVKSKQSMARCKQQVVDFQGNLNLQTESSVRYTDQSQQKLKKSKLGNQDSKSRSNVMNIQSNDSLHQTSFCRSQSKSFLRRNSQTTGSNRMPEISHLTLNQSQLKYLEKQILSEIDRSLSQNKRRKRSKNRRAAATGENENPNKKEESPRIINITSQKKSRSPSRKQRHQRSRSKTSHFLREKEKSLARQIANLEREVYRRVAKQQRSKSREESAGAIQQKQVKSSANQPRIPGSAQQPGHDQPNRDGHEQFSKEQFKINLMRKMNGLIDTIAQL